MDSDLKRLLVVLAAVLALVYMSYKVSTKYYSPQTSTHPVK
ncbi:hypothetical protein [Hymenobacter sediminis]|nr:hypothetical protein [Hymenobacter sediminis]